MGSFLWNFLKHTVYSGLRPWSIGVVVSVGNKAGRTFPDPVITYDESNFRLLLSISALLPLLEGWNRET